MKTEYWDGVEYPSLHKPTIILISGKAMHGKDTAADILKETLRGRVIITRFASGVKEMAERYFNWNGEKDEAGRTLLQWLGTDLIRSKYPDYWVDRTMSEIEALEDCFDYFIIPDTRFPNELLRRFRHNDVKRIQIVRTNYKSELTKEQQNHISETALDDYDGFDLVVTAESGDFESIRKQLEGLR